ncbi:glycosyltransferase [Vibrio pomeroyi]|uniref:glycosyltransferase n=1 Tax=Vibrio pomeroyi TaxID=198832 RepID=UPI0021C3EBEE|nr:glycosyltransferase [Vibrio pomeroyi]
MTIAYMITKGDIGGAQTWTRDQVHLFDGKEKQILITNKPGWLSDECSNLAKIFYFSKIERIFSILTLFSIVRVMRNQSVKTIVASSANAGIYARLCKILYPKVRVVYVSHGWSCIYNGNRFKKLFIMVEKLLSYITDAVLCVSEKDKYDAIEVIKIPAKKVKYIRNCVFPRSTAPFKVKGERIKVLFLGRLEHPKRPDLLIEAISGNPNFQLDIVGDGPLRASCKSSDNITFHGSIYNFNDFFKYDLFALISDSEGLPMAALEAASSGIPLMLSNVGGCPELITNNGLLVENCPDSIKKALICIEQNYSFYREQATSKSKDFDLSKHYAQYRQIYLSCS